MKAAGSIFWAVVLFWMTCVEWCRTDMARTVPIDWPAVLIILATYLQSVSRRKVAEVQRWRQPSTPHTEYQITNATIYSSCVHGPVCQNAASFRRCTLRLLHDWVPKILSMLTAYLFFGYPHATVLGCSTPTKGYEVQTRPGQQKTKQRNLVDLYA